MRGQTETEAVGELSFFLQMLLQYNIYKLRKRAIVVFSLRLYFSQTTLSIVILIFSFKGLINSPQI